ncbi:MAG: IS110 family transposase, partial [Paracoccaceae bacterium]
MEYFVGLDVSLRSCALCVVDGKGTVLLERDLPCDVCDIAECLAQFPHPIERIGFEAGTMSQHLFFGLTAEGFDVVCMEARQVNAALSAMRNKTDKTDARRIAHVLRTGWFSPVHMKSREAHGQRALLSTRKALLNKTIDLANEVRGLLKIFGLRLPKTVQHGSFDSLVRPMVKMDEILAHALIPLLDARLALYQHFLELDRRVKRAASHDAVCLRMMTVPGVGPIAALTFQAAVDDPARFKRSRTVAAHFGLTPRRYQSGEHDNPGRISKAGDRDVRAALYAAANALLMRTMAGSQIKSWGMRRQNQDSSKRQQVGCCLNLQCHDEMWHSRCN